MVRDAQEEMKQRHLGSAEMRVRTRRAFFFHAGLVCRTVFPLAASRCGMSIPGEVTRESRYSAHAAYRPGHREARLRPRRLRSNAGSG